VNNKGVDPTTLTTLQIEIKTSHLKFLVTYAYLTISLTQSQLLLASRPTVFIIIVALSRNS